MELLGHPASAEIVAVIVGSVLTEREREVMAFATSGLKNKQIAARIGLSEITVKVHRGNATRKMGVKSLADLVRMADSLGIRHTTL